MRIPHTFLNLNNLCAEHLHIYVTVYGANHTHTKHFKLPGLLCDSQWSNLIFPGRNLTRTSTQGVKMLMIAEASHLNTWEHSQDQAFNFRNR